MRYPASEKLEIVRRQGFRDNGLDKIKGGSGSSGW